MQNETPIIPANYSNRLTLSWSVSRGQDTYGYNIARLDSYNSGKRYRTCGGGYDMLGTVVGKFLSEEFQPQLRALFTLNQDKLKDYANGTMQTIPEFYGAFRKKSDNTVHLDGACGESAMWTIADAIGLEFIRMHNRKGHTTGYFVAKKG